MLNRFAHYANIFIIPYCMAGEISKSFINALIIMMILTGAANTIVYKFQNTYKAETNELGPDGKPFNTFTHPFMQAVTMFLGEALCYLLFINERKKPEYKSDCIEASAKGLKTKPNYFWVAIPAMCDLTASTLSYISLNFIPPSVYQMLRGGAIIATAFLSKFALKRDIKLYQWLGCALVLIGITLVGMSGVIFPEKKSNDDENDEGLGLAYFVSVGLLIISVIFNGLQFVSEEKLFEVYFLHPFEVVGVEGMWGFGVYVLLATSLTFVPCPDAMKDSCLPHNGNYFFERADMYFYQVFHNGLLAFWVLLGVFTIAAFNICGVSVTKYVSSLARSLVDVSRTVIIWAFGLILTYSSDKKWENTNPYAILVELLGFFILVTGNLIYNGTIRLPNAGGKWGYARVEEQENQNSLQEGLTSQNY